MKRLTKPEYKAKLKEVKDHIKQLDKSVAYLCKQANNIYKAAHKLEVKYGYLEAHSPFVTATGIDIINGRYVDFIVEFNDSGYETSFTYDQLADPTDYLIDVEEGLMRVSSNEKEMDAMLAHQKYQSELVEYKRLKKKFEGQDVG